MSKLTAAKVRKIIGAFGFVYAVSCVEQAEKQGDATEARAELNRMLRNMAANEH